jgi:alkanesulfonate monooxygenase SsuD/methylene tetrahydromethanopterin reductase-like flavin-dependent oxidoreductase (luciferase family)
MQYGVHLPPFGPYGDARTLAGLARDAEMAGWDGFFIWDHIAPADWWPEPMVDPWVALAAIALRTRRIRIGALVTPLPRRRPWKVAREAVSIDHLSGGRLIFGVGTGGSVTEWDNLGEATDPKVRGAMLDEALIVLTGLWSGETFNFEGQYYHVKNTRFLPGPVQKPRIPIWVASFWPHKAPLRRAVKWDGAFPLTMTEGEAEVQQMREIVAYLRERRTGTEPFDIVYAGRPTPGNNRAEALEIVSIYAEIGFTWWLENINPLALGKSMKDEWPLAALRERILQGPPK